MTGPSGRSGSGGWILEGTGSHPDADRNASIHESFHHRLDRSTNFGAVMIAYAGVVDAGAGASSVLGQLRDTCRTVHESAATYLTSLALGRLDEHTTYSPHYRRYYDGMDELVGGDSTPAWIRFHTALAIARACLQPDIAAVVDECGLGEIKASSFRNVSLADERFRRLRANPPDADRIAVLGAAVADLLEGDTRQHERDLEASWFNPEDHHVYEAYETAAWDEVASRLETEGCGVDTIDAHLRFSNRLLDQGRALGAVYDIVADGTAQTATERVWAALGPLDHETIALPATRTAHRVDLRHVENLNVLAAGTGEHAHLHLSIRPTSSYHHFDWTTDRPQGSVCLRRTLETDDGRSIEHTDITAVNPDRLEAEWAGPVIATISESMLTNPHVVQWVAAIGDHRVLLCDTPLIARLQYWATMHWPFRFMFMSLQAADASSPVMVARFQSGDGDASTPIVKPMTPQVVNTIRQALRELDPTNVWATEDNSLADELPGIGLALYHVIGEDLVFGVTPIDDR